jgi:hypothetical protein
MSAPLSRDPIKQDWSVTNKSATQPAYKATATFKVDLADGTQQEFKITITHKSSQHLQIMMQVVNEEYQKYKSFDRAFLKHVKEVNEDIPNTIDIKISTLKDKKVTKGVPQGKSSEGERKASAAAASGVLAPKSTRASPLLSPQAAGPPPRHAPPTHRTQRQTFQPPQEEPPALREIRLTPPPPSPREAEIKQQESQPTRESRTDTLKVPYDKKSHVGMMRDRWERRISERTAKLQSKQTDKKAKMERRESIPKGIAADESAEKEISMREKSLFEQEATFNASLMTRGKESISKQDTVMKKIDFISQRINLITEKNILRMKKTRDFNSMVRLAKSELESAKRQLSAPSLPEHLKPHINKKIVKAEKKLKEVKTSINKKLAVIADQMVDDSGILKDLQKTQEELLAQIQAEEDRSGKKQ